MPTVMDSICCREADLDHVLHSEIYLTNVRPSGERFGGCHAVPVGPPSGDIGVTGKDIPELKLQDGEGGGW